VTHVVDAGFSLGKEMGFGLSMRFIFVGMFLVWLVALMALIPGDPVEHDGAFLHLQLEGEILEAPSSDPLVAIRGGSPLTLWEINQAIVKASQDDRVGGLVLEVGTPLMSQAQIEEFGSHLEIFRQTGKPIRAHLRSVGFGGDRYFALAALADTINLVPSGQVNLLGTRLEIPFFKGLFDKLKVGVFMEKRKEFKAGAEQFMRKDLSPKAKESLVELVNEIESNLVELIAKRRSSTEKIVRRWLATGPHNARKALADGMVDTLSYRDQFYSALQKETQLDEPLVAFDRYARFQTKESGKVTMAFITGEGAISYNEDPGGFSGPSFSARQIMRAFSKARESEVKGVLFRVNSPGGGYLPSDLVRREVQKTRESGIPVVVSMGSYAASGGYFVSMAADHIVAHPSTITGSIGVYGGKVAMRDFFEHWLGLSFDTYSTTAVAGTYSSLDPPNITEQKFFERFLDDTYEDFVQKAASDRKQSFDVLEKVARGRVWTGEDALKHGLVDSLGGMSDALEVLRGLAKLKPDDTIELRQFPPAKSPVELLQDFVGQSTAALPPLSSRLRAYIRWLDEQDATLMLPWGLLWQP
jgi:protease IV